MKLKHVVMIFILCGLSVSAMSQDWWSKYKLKFLEESAEGNQVLTRFQESSGTQFTVLSPATLDEAGYQQILPLKEIVSSWQKIKLKETRFVIAPQSIDMLVVPEKISYEGKNLADYLPAGILFYRKNDLIYFNAHLLIDKKVIKQNQEYKSEMALLELLWNVIEKPEAFVGKTGTPQVEAGDEGKPKDITQLQTKGQENWPKPFKPHILRLYAGTGALLHGAYGLGWHNFELQGTLGIAADKKEVAVNNRLEKQWMLGVPIGLRLQYFFFQNDLFQPYMMGGGMYALGVSNYQSRMLGYFGVGEQIFKHFYGEVAYMLGGESQSLVIGLGIKLEFE